MVEKTKKNIYENLPILNKILLDSKRANYTDLFVYCYNNDTLSLLYPAADIFKQIDEQDDVSKEVLDDVKEFLSQLVIYNRKINQIVEIFETMTQNEKDRCFKILLDN